MDTVIPAKTLKDALPLLGRGCQAASAGFQRAESFGRRRPAGGEGCGAQPQVSERAEKPKNEPQTSWDRIKVGCTNLKSPVYRVLLCYFMCLMV